MSLSPMKLTDGKQNYEPTSTGLFVVCLQVNAYEFKSTYRKYSVVVITQRAE